MPTLNLQVSASSDDAHELESSGAVNITGAEVVMDDSLNDFGRYWGGFRWVDSTLQQGYTIDGCIWKPYIATAKVDDPQCDIYFEKVAGPVTFTTTTDDISDRTRTTASIEWDAVGVGSGGFISSPELKTVLQEVVSAYSPTAIVLITIPKGVGASSFRAVSYDNDTAKAAKLDVDYSSGITLTPSPVVISAAVPIIVIPRLRPLPIAIASSVPTPIIHRTLVPDAVAIPTSFPTINAALKWRITSDTHSTANDGTFADRIIRFSDGTLLAVWNDGEDVWYALSYDNGEYWQNEVRIIDTGSTGGTDTAVVLDAANDIAYGLATGFTVDYVWAFKLAYSTVTKLITDSYVAESATAGGKATPAVVWNVTKSRFTAIYISHDGGDARAYLLEYNSSLTKTRSGTWPEDGFSRNPSMLLLDEDDEELLILIQREPWPYSKWVKIVTPSDGGYNFSSDELNIAPGDDYYYGKLIHAPEGEVDLLLVTADANEYIYYQRRNVAGSWANEVLLEDSGSNPTQQWGAAGDDSGALIVCCNQNKGLYRDANGDWDAEPFNNPLGVISDQYRVNLAIHGDSYRAAMLTTSLHNLYYADAPKPTDIKPDVVAIATAVPAPTIVQLATPTPVQILSVVSTPTIVPGEATLIPTAASSASIAVTPVVVPGEATLTPSLTIIASATPTPIVIPGGTVLTPDAVAASFIVATITVVVTLKPAVLPIPSVVPALTLVPGEATLALSPVTIPTAITTPTIILGPVIAEPSSVSIATAVPVVVVVPGEASLTPSSTIIFTSLPFILTILSLTLSLDTLAIPSSIPTPTLVPGAISLTPDSTTSSFALPATTVVPGTATLTPDALSIPSAVLTIIIIAGSVSITPDAITIVSVVSIPVVIQILYPTAVSSATAVPGATLVIGTVTLTPTSVQSPVVTQSPQVVLEGILGPDALAFTTTLPAVTVVPGTATLSVSVVSTTISVATPSLIPGETILIPTAVEVAFITVIPTVLGGTAILSPSATSIAITPVIPTLSAGSVSLLPAVIAIISQTPDIVVTPGIATITPIPRVILTVIPIPTVVAGQLLIPDVVSTTSSVPTLQLNLLVYLDPVTVPTAIAISTLIPGTATLIVSVVVVPATLPVPTVTIPETLSPDSVVILAVLPTSAVTIGVTVLLPVPKAISLMLPAPGITPGGATLLPDSLAAPWIIPAPVVFIGLYGSVAEVDLILQSGRLTMALKDATLDLIYQSGAFSPVLKDAALDLAKHSGRVDIMKESE